MALTNPYASVYEGGTTDPASVSSGVSTVNNNSGDSNPFVDWLLSLGRDYYSRTTAGTSDALEGAYNIQQALSGNDAPITNSYNEAKSGTTFSDLLDRFNDGELTATQFFEEVAKLGIRLTASQQDFITHLLTRESKDEQYDRDVQYIKDSIEATQQAASGAGLNSSAFLMSQGAGSGLGAGKSSVSGLEATREASLNRFNSKASMARTLLGLIGGMGAAGIHGASLYAAKSAVANITSSAALSAKMMNRRVGKSRYDGKGRFLYHETYDYDY